ncbi:MAG TPA: 4a-hydroxytetrahydrobiopterin dehydratase [Gammaproteobacteria bacterium]|nr:4a-hydroxytetrahydrobiopterin dehydratase [Gammaproteobacteria bacterium]
MTTCDLQSKHCVPCEGGVPALTKQKAEDLLKKLNNWQVNSEGSKITRRFDFKNFYKTMAFVNAIAWIANQENHHPDMEVGYNYCVVHYTTHAISGLSENDFICAAKVDALG